MTKLEFNKIEWWQLESVPLKLIYCNDCEIEEVVYHDDPDSCPFCESKNVRVEGRESIPKEDTKDGGN